MARAARIAFRRLLKDVRSHSNCLCSVARAKKHFVALANVELLLFA